MTSDASILQHVSALIDEEHRLRGNGAASPVEAQRLRHVEQQLDQCWDLLRQRRARREFGENPEEAQVRRAPEVEGYQQ